MGKSKWNFYVIFFVLILICIILKLLFFSQQGIPVLNYHQINNQDHNALTLSTTEFAAQMKDLAEEGYTTITPDQLLDYLQQGMTLPEKPVLITFDDGYKDNYFNAYPILKQYKFNATIFLISSLVNKDHYLSWQEIQEMKNNNILFEGHTFSHPHLNQVKDEKILQQELLDSKEDLEKNLGYKIDCLAYPYGDYDQHVISMVQKYGYRAAFTVHLGSDMDKDNPYTLNRVPIFQSQTHTFLRFWISLHFPAFMNYIQTEKVNFSLLHI
ncbi:polysaccharide deacetylase family protein [Propionispira raffinosivorans]|uniref:polysaccharide deacetylase family protein n=1 Tax=Propionispira raffinosivorans TaxID=86959 RepID=UPI00037FC069|nr:polysaccharide deacetylase family protein [Propionispira raffinosivorans]